RGRVHHDVACVFGTEFFTDRMCTLAAHTFAFVLPRSMVGSMSPTVGYGRDLAFQCFELGCLVLGWELDLLRGELALRLARLEVMPALPPEPQASAGRHREIRAGSQAAGGATRAGLLHQRAG